ncbi:MAG: NYN domain-containing protein [Chloroflexota bacterium]
MPRLTIVDGYNVIRRDPALSRLERQSLETAREALVRRLATDARLRKDEVTVVFDGGKGGLAFEHSERRGGVRLIFSRFGETADEVIKRLVNAASGDVRVISNDRELRDHTARQGGTPVRVVPRPRYYAPRENEEDTPQRANKKGPARREKKRRRQPDPYWSP